MARSKPTWRGPLFTTEDIESLKPELSTIPGRFTAHMANIVLAIFQENHTVTTIAHFTGKDTGQVCNTLKTLLPKQIIRQEDDTKQYFLTPVLGRAVKDKLISYLLSTNSSKGVRTLNTHKTRSNRGHNIRVKFKIDDAPPGWKESPKEFFKLQHMDAEEIHVKNMDGVQFTLDEYIVKAMRTHVYVVMRTPTYGSWTPDIMLNIFEQSFALKATLEKKFPQLRLGDRPIINVGEIAHEQDPLALLKEKDGYQVIYHTDGRARLVFDKSKGFIELEWVHPGMHDEDSETHDIRMLELVDSPFGPIELAVRSEQQEFRQDETDARIDKLLTITELLVQAVEPMATNVNRIAQAMSVAHNPSDVPQTPVKSREERPGYFG